MCGRLPELAGKRVVLVLTGGNIDLAVLGRVIEHGLVADGRLCRFTATISDRPGGWRGSLSESLLREQVSRRSRTTGLSPDRTYTVNVLCTVETADHRHIAELYRQLCEEGIAIASKDKA